MNAPELKPAGEWQESIVLTSSLGMDNIILMNTDLVRRIQDDAIAHARYQALTEAAEIARGKRIGQMDGFATKDAIKDDIIALRDAKET